MIQRSIRKITKRVKSNKVITPCKRLPRESIRETMNVRANENASMRLDFYSEREREREREGIVICKFSSLFFF